MGKKKKKKRNKLWDVWKSDYKKNLEESNGKKIKNGGKKWRKRKKLIGQNNDFLNLKIFKKNQVHIFEI